MINNKILNYIKYISYKYNQSNILKYKFQENIYFQEIVYLLFIISFVFNFNCSIYAQSSQKVSLEKSEKIRIDSITISGAKTTKEFIILRELNFSAGDTVNQKILDYNESRVMSLRLFYSVEFKIFKKKSKNILNINVKESWYIFPVPFVKIQSNKISRSNYGIDLNWNNFRGRNETIRGFISFGYDPSYGLFYSNPVLISNTEISFSAGIVNQTINNKSKVAELIAGSDFDYKLFRVYAGLGYRINPFNAIYFRLGYSTVESQFTKNGITASGTTFDKVPSFTLFFKHDTRDLIQYPEDGLFTAAYITHKGFGLQNISYFITGFDFREYRKLFLTNLISKWRVAFRKTFGKTIPFYDYSYLGFNEFVRGHKNDERGGNNSLIGSLEFSYPLLKELEFSVKLPFLPQSLTSYLVSIRLSIFGDTGVTFNNDELITIKKFDSGYGVGLTILFLPYNALRFEYAFNEFGKGEFLFGTKFSF